MTTAPASLAELAALAVRQAAEGPVATDAVDRALRAASASQLLSAALVLVPLGLFLARTVARLADRHLKPPRDEPRPPLAAIPSGWPPAVRLLAWFGVRLKSGEPRSLTPAFLWIAIVAWLAAQLAGALASSRFIGDGPSGDPALRVVRGGAGLLVAAPAFLLFAAAWIKASGGRLADLGLTLRGAVRSLALSLALYVAFLPAYLGAIALENALSIWLTGRLPTQQAAVIAYASDASLRGNPLLLAGFVLAAPLIEELFFRGIVLRYLGRLLPAAAAIALDAALFALPHDAGRLPVFALGAALAWLMRRTGSLAAPLAFHVLHNGLTLALIARTAGG